MVKSSAVWTVDWERPWSLVRVLGGDGRGFERRPRCVHGVNDDDDEWCERVVRGDDLCSAHLRHASAAAEERGGVRVYEQRPAHCVAEGCERAVLARGLCSMHYRRNARGQTLVTAHELASAALSNSRV